MINLIKIEWLKMKRTSSHRLLWLGPIIFVLFCYSMTLLMGENPEGKSYLMAVAFNWFPTLILPILIAILVVNIWSREKPIHQMLYKSHNISNLQTFLAKSIILVIQLFFIISLSGLLIFLMNTLIIKSYLNLSQLILSCLCLTIGSLPTVGICLVLVKRVPSALVYVLALVLNFIPAALMAVKSFWVFYPWAYTMRLMAVTAKVHPNGTFLPSNHPFLDLNNLFIGIILSIGVFCLFIFLGLWQKDKE
ncbi:ABC transporter permease [Vaginisenegalia massiliensis]|uniref:ABC transporter permease n=1 Tax=Vaginisenegalia massiliensis TaxID=2058294 RepID=UPI000F52DF1F|nr:ABC transporter permease [Vaginisenegalia massiliensis]